MGFHIIPLTAADENLVREMFHRAIYVPPGESPLPLEVVDQDDLRHYWSGWGRPDDFGFRALVPNDSSGVGALGDDVSDDDAHLPAGLVWARLLKGDFPGFGYLDDETPELGIAVREPYRGRGLGTLLMNRLIDAARGRYPALCLSVQAANPALALYERLGFRDFKHEGDSIKMKLVF